MNRIHDGIDFALLGTPALEPPTTASALLRNGAVQSSAEHTLKEELRSTRAELLNTDEQMESANEEVDTSKEELQSFNEELHTINNQRQHKVQELEDFTNNHNNLSAGTEIKTVYLDGDGRIARFPPASKTLLDLVPSNIGRLLGHFVPRFTDDNLLLDTQTVLKGLTYIEAEVHSDAGRSYLRRVLPYRTQDNGNTGIVLTFAGISKRKRTADAVNEERLHSQAIFETIRQPLLVLDVDLCVRSANRAFYALFEVAPEDTENKSIYALGNNQWDIPALRTLLEQLMPTNDIIDDFVVEHEFKTMGRRTMLLNARRLSHGGGPADLILLAIEDITARSQAEAHRDLLIGELSHRVRNVLATVQAVVSQTLRQSASLEAFKTAFRGRLRALAQAQALLADERRDGADIGQLVCRSLEPYRTGDGVRITTLGHDLNVPPRAGVALVMILHELATNAAKYGALSAPDGKLRVTWELEDGEDGLQVHLLWIETGGPRVEQPSRRGFGTNLIERSLAQELRGKAVLDFQAAGLRCKLTFPWQPPSRNGGTSRARLTGRVRATDIPQMWKSCED